MRGSIASRRWHAVETIECAIKADEPLALVNLTVLDPSDAPDAVHQPTGQSDPYREDGADDGERFRVQFGFL